MLIFNFWELFCHKIAKTGQYRFKNKKYGIKGSPSPKNREIHRPCFF